MFNIINNATLVKVDCIVRKDESLEIEKFSRRRKSKIGDVEFWVIGKEDLILSKLKWAANSHSERQFDDVRKLQEAGVDEELLIARIKQMGLDNVWKAFETWKTRISK